MSDFVNQRVAEAAQRAEDRARVAEGSALAVSKRFSRYRRKYRQAASERARACFAALMGALHGKPPSIKPHVWPPPDASPKPPPFVADRFSNLEIE